jgi:phosphatidylglycerol:prolipoprotein diacylglycerol transferase
VEFLFNAVMLGVILRLRGRGSNGQLFHIYLISYGIFRFVHEFLRETPRVLMGLSGYQFAALGIVILGAAGYARRARLQGELACPESTEPIRIGF